MEKQKGKKSAEIKRICGICNNPIEGNYFELDHIIPKSYGGPDLDWNLRATHSECNLRRRNHIEPMQPPLFRLGGKGGAVCYPTHLRNVTKPKS